MTISTYGTYSCVLLLYAIVVGSTSTVYVKKNIVLWHVSEVSTWYDLCGNFQSHFEIVCPWWLALSSDDEIACQQNSILMRCIANNRFASTFLHVFRSAHHFLFEADNNKKNKSISLWFPWAPLSWVMIFTQHFNATQIRIHPCYTTKKKYAQFQTVIFGFLHFFGVAFDHRKQMIFGVRAALHIESKPVIKLYSRHHNKKTVIIIAMVCVRHSR